MANMVEGDIVFKGKTADVVKFLADAYKRCEEFDGRELNTIADCEQAWYDITSKQKCEPRFVFHLRSWIPMPETYDKYDLTSINVPNLKVGDVISDQLRDRDKNFEVTPEILKEYQDAYEEQKALGHIGWYDYNCATIGTKWDMALDLESDPTFNDYGDEASVAFIFESPWSPVIQWCKEIHKLYPGLDMSYMYREYGMDFFGGVVVKDGKFIEVDEVDVPKYFPDEVDGYFAPIDWDDEE